MVEIFSSCCLHHHHIVLLFKTITLSILQFIIDVLMFVSVKYQVYYSCFNVVLVKYQFIIYVLMFVSLQYQFIFHALLLYQENISILMMLNYRTS